MFSEAAVGRLRRVKLYRPGANDPLFFSGPALGLQKAAMAKGLNAFSCLLLKASLGEQGLPGPVMTPQVAFWLVSRRTFSGQEGLSRRTIPVLTLSILPISVVG